MNTRGRWRRRIRRVTGCALALLCTTAVIASCTANPPHSPESSHATVPAIPVSSCEMPTTVTIWAHTDDDLLFAHEPIANEIAAHDCVRTIYVTAGDAGLGRSYVQNREEGIRAAYGKLIGDSAAWQSSTVVLTTGVRVKVTWPHDDSRVALFFFELPDGNIDGKGFPSTGNTSLPELLAGQIGRLRSISGATSVTRDSLIASLAEIIRDVGATRLVTSVPATAAAASRGDHPDHAAVGVLAGDAWRAAGRSTASAIFAIGYQTAYLPANLTPPEVDQKGEVFVTYASHDQRRPECVALASCLLAPHYGAWLQREYRLSEGDLTDYIAPVMPAAPLAPPGSQ